MLENGDMCKAKKDKRLVFQTIKNGEIFSQDFLNFRQNNTIDFTSKNIAAIYAPNGVGKTSLANVLNGKNGTSFKINYNGVSIEDNKQKFFHIIADQNKRNIIQGETEDFILGDNIRYERQLKKEIDNEINSFWEQCQQELQKYGVSKKSSALIDDYPEEIREQIKGLAKRGGRSKSADDFLIVVNKIEKHASSNDGILDVFSPKAKEYIQDRNIPDSVINLFLKFIIVNHQKIEHMQEIEENTDAIMLLQKYHSKKECIICDSKINPYELMNTKENNKNNLLNKLDKKTKALVEKFYSIPDSLDMFGIKKAVSEYFETEDWAIVENVKQEIVKFGQQLAETCIASMQSIFASTQILRKIAEYKELIAQEPDLTEEDELYIREIVEQSMDKKISIARRKGDKELIIELEDNEIIGKDRDNLSLSAGEQNFLSLAFEMLKAKNSNSSIIVLDDPISSFDSIYKYKIVYAILKFLESKNVIILTHNIDLIRLINCQKEKSFCLYILNNNEDKDNGFVGVKDEEVGLMTDLSRLINFFRDKKIMDNIKDGKKFLISMVPFMRSYAKITNCDVYNATMPIMHSRKIKKVDIGKCYNDLFSNKTEFWDEGKYQVDYNDIIGLELRDDTEIIDKEKYPLLNKALNTSIQYLKLRLLTESRLINQFGISDKKKKLGEIILFAYKNNTSNRVKLMSKKTLLNEFNHFEGDLSIFQPAIDISSRILKKERKDIENFFKGEDWKMR